MSIFSRFSSWRERFRLGGSSKTPREKALLPLAILAMLEDIISWENPQLSLGFLAFVNVIFFAFIQMDITLTECLFICGMTYVCLDGAEMWLRRKHRTACLERLARCDNVRLQCALARTAGWLGRQKDEFLAMRESNPTKAFLVANMVFGVIFVIGKTISGVMLCYLVSMLTILYPLYSVYIHRAIKKMHQASDSDAEIEGLIPEMSEQNMKDLNIETDSVATRHSVEPWLPEGSPGRDLSDSDSDSRSSASLPLPLPRPAHHDPDALEPRDSDSSDEEYLPKLEEEDPPTTVQLLPSQPSWGGDAASALWSLGGTLGNLGGGLGALIKPTPKDKTPTSPQADSSDDFEFLDQSDL